MLDTDLKRILSQYNIEYREFGKNVAQGNINICCPYCKELKFHLGIDYKNELFGCWRNVQHSGKLIRLFNFLNINYNFKVKNYQIDDEFNNQINQLFNKSEQVNTIKLQLLKEFEYITKTGTGERFWYYLYNRGFIDVQRLIDRFNLLCCKVGDKWKDRIIIPITFNNELVTWSARTIHSYNELRYDTLSNKDSVKSIKHTLFDYDNIKKGGDVLFITEGPFDAMKVTYECEHIDILVTCLYGLKYSDVQLNYITELSDKFNKMIILLDRNEIQTANKLLENLSFLSNLYIANVPKHRKDPGEMNKSEILSII